MWDRFARREVKSEVAEPTVEGVRRLGSSVVFIARELAGPTGALALLAVLGLFLLGAFLPHGALQAEVEQMDPLAPLKMSVVSLLVYATPMLAMSQLGMMFDHGNSPGAAFSLLLLGTGVNLATLWWIRANFGTKSTLVWFSVLFVFVVGIAYAVDRPLIPPGIEPAGHTHAFDVYTNPLTTGSGVSFSKIQETIEKSVGLFEWIGGGMLALIVIFGGVLRFGFRKQSEALMNPVASENDLNRATKGIHRPVSSRTVGLTCLAGVVAFSIVGCYAYYPKPSEVLEEMRLARVEVLSGAMSKDYDRSLRWIPILDAWSRRLEVGYAIRNFELRPYQKMQTYIMRKKLELLEHAIEHASEFADAVDSGDLHARVHLEEELGEIDELRAGLGKNAPRLRNAFNP